MQIIIRPVLTEKMTAQGEKLNRFAFIVDRRANKIQIRQAVEDMYGVVVTDVNTVNYMGKEKSRLIWSGYCLVKYSLILLRSSSFTPSSESF